VYKANSALTKRTKVSEVMYNLVTITGNGNRNKSTNNGIIA